MGNVDSYCKDTETENETVPSPRTQCDCVIQRRRFSYRDESEDVHSTRVYRLSVSTPVSVNLPEAPLTADEFAKRKKGKQPGTGGGDDGKEESEDESEEERVKKRQKQEGKREESEEGLEESEEIQERLGLLEKILVLRGAEEFNVAAKGRVINAYRHLFEYVQRQITEVEEGTIDKFGARSKLWYLFREESEFQKDIDEGFAKTHEEPLFAAWLTWATEAFLNPDEFSPVPFDTNLGTDWHGVWKRALAYKAGMRLYGRADVILHVLEVALASVQVVDVREIESWLYGNMRQVTATDRKEITTLKESLARITRQRKFKRAADKGNVLARMKKNRDILEKANKTEEALRRVLAELRLHTNEIKRIKQEIQRLNTEEFTLQLKLSNLEKDLRTENDELMIDFIEADIESTRTALAQTQQQIIQLQTSLIPHEENAMNLLEKIIPEHEERAKEAAEEAAREVVNLESWKTRREKKAREEEEEDKEEQIRIEKKIHRLERGIGLAAREEAEEGIAMQPSGEEEKEEEREHALSILDRMQASRYGISGVTVFTHLFRDANLASSGAMDTRTFRESVTLPLQDEYARQLNAQLKRRSQAQPGTQKACEREQMRYWKTVIDNRVMQIEKMGTTVEPLLRFKAFMRLYAIVYRELCIDNLGKRTLFHLTHLKSYLNYLLHIITERFNDKENFRDVLRKESTFTRLCIISKYRWRQQDLEGLLAIEREITKETKETKTSTVTSMQVEGEEVEGEEVEVLPSGVVCPRLERVQSLLQRRPVLDPFGRSERAGNTEKTSRITIPLAMQRENQLFVVPATSIEIVSRLLHEGLGERRIEEHTRAEEAERKAKNSVHTLLMLAFSLKPPKHSVIVADPNLEIGEMNIDGGLVEERDNVFAEGVQTARIHFDFEANVTFDAKFETEAFTASARTDTNIDLLVAAMGTLDI